MQIALASSLDSILTDMRLAFVAKPRVSWGDPDRNLQGLPPESWLVWCPGEDASLDGQAAPGPAVGDIVVQMRLCDWKGLL